MKQNFKLTKDQQTLVEKNLSIVHWVIVNNIHVNPGICGLEYGDLFQEGCLWLCKAAFTYHAGQAQFSTYAKKVVKNGLLSYCRKICSQGRHVSRLIIGEQGELAADGEQVDQPDDHFDSHLSRLETLDLLEASKQNYQGVARLMAQIFVFGRVMNDLVPKESQSKQSYVCFDLMERTKNWTQFYQVWAWDADVTRLMQFKVKKGSVIWLAGSQRLVDVRMKDGKLEKKLKVSLNDFGFLPKQPAAANRQENDPDITAEPAPPLTEVLDGDRESLPE